MSARDAEGLGVVGVGWRGLLMGLAEVVPGVSGGTIALVTGIYPTLVSSLASFGLHSLRQLTSPRAFWRDHNLGFLITLAGGMALGVLAFAHLMTMLLSRFQPAVWAFFLGVIAMSVWVVGRRRALPTLLRWAPLGLAGGLGLLWLPAAEGATPLWYVFTGGAIAVCAWILPAVSGSYVMLVLGLYETVIQAIAELDWLLLAVLAAGCVTGLALFVRLLDWLLARHGEVLLSVLTGFMLGSLVNLWPWRTSQSDWWQALQTPGGYQALTGEPAYLTASLVCMLAGAGGLWWIARADTA